MRKIREHRDKASIAFDNRINDLFPEDKYNKPRQTVIITLKLIGFQKERKYRRWELYIGDSDRIASSHKLSSIVRILQQKVESLTPEEFRKLLKAKTREFEAASRKYSECDYDKYVPLAVRHIWQNYKYRLYRTTVGRILGINPTSMQHFISGRTDRKNRYWRLNKLEEIANVFECSLLDVIKLAQTLYWIDKQKEKENAVH